MKTFPILVLTVLLLTGCHWLKKKDDPSPLEQLPPATQEGKRAFACLVNGQVWIPQGNNGTSNYSIYYDPTYRKGTLNISTYRYPRSSNNDGTDKQTIDIYSDSLSTTGKFLLNKPGRQGAGFNDRLKSCDYDDRDKDTYLKGSLTITRLDPTLGIISGTFEFTLAKPGCDTVKVTNGRFDYKL